MSVAILTLENTRELRIDTAVLMQGSAVPRGGC